MVNETSSNQHQQASQKHTHLVVVLLGIAVSLVILGVVGTAYISNYNELHEKSKLLAQTELKYNSSKFDDYLSKNLTVCDITSTSLDYLLENDTSVENIRNFLDSQSKQYKISISPNLSTVYGYFKGHYIDPDSWERDDDYNPLDRPWYKHAIAAEGNATASPPYLDAQTKDMVSSICKRLKDPQSVVACDINLKILNDILKDNESNNYGYCFAFHTDGYIIAHKDPKEIGKNYLLTDADNKVSQSAQQERADFLQSILDNHKKGIYETDVNLEGKKSIIISSQVKQDWHIVIVIYEELLFKSAKNSLLSNTLITCISIILIAIFVIVCFLKVVKANDLLAISQKDLRLERDHVIAAEKSRSLFFAAVSHDIRTPLNAILGFSELLKLGVEDEDTRQKYLDSIVFNGKTLAELINDILDLSKLDAGKMTFNLEYVNCHKLANALLMSFNLKASQENVKLISDLPQTLPSFKLDPHRIRQILFNLLGNAVKFTHHGSITLKITFTPKNADTCDLGFAVKDTGIGIAEENLAKLAQPFSQFGDAKHSAIGTGLGLSICKQMIEKMNGEFKIESKIGQGSTFSFILHNVTYNEKSITSENIKVDPQTPKDDLSAKYNWRLLLVDDSPVNLKVLNAMCQKLGFNNTIQAANGLLALDIMQKEHIDLVFTDMWMPKMNGEELAKAIRQNDKLKSTPVYAVTADVDAQKDYTANGFTGLLLKPITIARLKEIMTEASNVV